uniref:40S ribosomal protein S21 n=1 Tax=Rhizophora mucronata TaxID=61149 RepID=A0A2P2JVD1_RHIMU
MTYVDLHRRVVLCSDEPVCGRAANQTHTKEKRITNLSFHNQTKQPTEKQRRKVVPFSGYVKIHVLTLFILHLG